MFQKFFGKMVKIKETSFFSTRGMILIFGNCNTGVKIKFTCQVESLVLSVTLYIAIATFMSFHPYGGNGPSRYFPLPSYRSPFRPLLS